MSEAAATLRARIESGDVVVGVIGLGYVGLPLSLAFAESGVRTLGFDIDQTKVERLDRGESYFDHLDGGRITAVRESDVFSATADFERLGEPDALLICVPTPLTPQRDPDMRYVVGTAETIARTLRPGQLVVLESTTYPGTTEELLRAILDQAGLDCGDEYFLAYSPEREDPGNPEFTTSSIPKLVGGVNPVSAELAEALYGRVVVETIRVSSARTAEATKLMENIFRAVNIALVNELKIVYDAMEIDIWEVLDAAETKPFGFMRFDPGPGWGGHCIPIDPFYLAWKAREYGLPAKFIERAGEVNLEMPRHVVSELQARLNERGKPLRDSRILLLGLAYKKDVDDTRESPAIEIIRRLDDSGAEWVYHDPYVAEIPPTRRYPEAAGRRSVPLTAEELDRADAVVIVTDHSAVDYELVTERAEVLVDPRGVARRSAVADGGCGS